MCLDWMMTMKLNFGFWETLLQVEMEASLDELPMDLWPSFATSEDYHSTVAVNSLMRILRDPSLASYHQKVVGSLMFIFKVLPDLFHTVRTCYDSLKDFITWKLGTLVSIVRQHIHKYLPELLSLISELWSSIGLLATNRPSRGYPMLQNYNDNLVPFMIPAKSGGSQAVRVVLTSSKEDRDLLLERLRNIDEEANKKIRGFREVIDLISASQKPIVSHNSLNGWCFSI
ncbi:Serine/threonine-protein kinase TOR [Linum grandiflorum]